MFTTYVDLGGNFIDTANQYNRGTSEEFVGDFSAGIRDSLVIATKYTLPMGGRDPNSGGNHRKSMIRSVEGSLRRLNTDYIDLLYLHAWDSTTPVEEILRSMDDLVRSGKVLYLGISDTPAWQISRMQMMADLRGWTPLIALEIEYSLIQRTGERDLIPMALELGLGVIPFSPLGDGVLTGKYKRVGPEPSDIRTSEDSARKQLVIESNGLSDRNFAIVDVAQSIATEIGQSPARVSLAWILSNPAITSPILGARTCKQLVDNLGAVEVQLSDAHIARLSRVSAIELGFPHDFLATLLTSDYMSAAMNVSTCGGRKALDVGIPDRDG